MPSITPEVEQMVLAKDQLMLEGAQLALLRFDTGVYADRIAATASWVGERYNTDSALVGDWLSELESLKAMAPVSDFPDISGSLAELRSVIAKEG